MRADDVGWVEPMLATLTDRRSFDTGWLFERKLDGVRTLAIRAGGPTRLVSRNRNDVTASYPEIAAKLIEEKANGAAVIATLRESIPGLIPVQVDGSKEARAHSTTPHVEAGNWFLPHPAIAPWVNEFIDELAGFPTGANDDYVDTFSQLDRYLFGQQAYGWDAVAAEMMGRG